MNIDATELLLTAGAEPVIGDAQHNPPSILHVACARAGAALKPPEILSGADETIWQTSPATDDAAAVPLHASSDPRIAAQVLALLVDHASDEHLAAAAAATDAFGRSPLHCLCGSVAAAAASPAGASPDKENLARDAALRESLCIVAESLARAAPAAGSVRDIAGRTPREILKAAQARLAAGSPSTVGSSVSEAIS